MKILRKINKGLILTIIVLIALVLYFNNLEKQREAEKTDIKATCEEFIKLTDKYSVLPEDMQIIQKEMPEERVKKYVGEMRAELEKIMITNTESINIQSQILEENLRNGYNELEVRTKLSRKIQKISSYEFEGNQVTVNLKDQVERTIKATDGMEEHNENSSFEASKDQIILKKENGKWKVVYANLQFDDTTRYYEDSMELR
ncbi:MAG: hypothetical protein BHW02_02675 [Clostridium sp. 28_12]|nr:MAG: hypothetical protein BHW02_02675 [Clostridium sp. 28_12]